MMGMRKGALWIAAAVLAPFVVLAIGRWIETPTAAQTKMLIPRFEVDPVWPKPLPNNQIIGWVMGISADAKDNIWILQRADVIPIRDTAAPRLDKEAMTQDIRMAVPRTIKDRARLLGEWMKTAV